jgi:hypothetical protein
MFVIIKIPNGWYIMLEYILICPNGVRGALKETTDQCSKTT